MQEELHLDGEEGILQSLINEGTDYVRSAVNYGLPVEEYEKYPLLIVP